jgi:hypothetical protein
MQIVDVREDEGCRPWVAFRQGWTRLLMGESPARVRATLMQAGVLQNGVMVRALNMYLAALDVLEERFADAEALLEKISADFDQSAHFLELFAVRVYQASVYEQQGRVGRLREALERSLGWAEETGVDYFPHYWHPQIVAGVCVAALRLGVHSRQAELMIIRRLGDVAAPGLVGLLADESLALSEGAVKKHIAAIRAAFGIRSRGGRDRGRQEVRALAQQAGFVAWDAGL